MAEETHDPLLGRLQEKILRLKEERRLEGSYMTIGELLDDEREEGWEEGHEEGRKMMKQNITSLISVISTEDMEQLRQNPELLEGMFQKYLLTS